MDENPTDVSRPQIGDRPASLAVIQAVAAYRDVEPTEMDDILCDYVDPDALDALIRDGGTGPVTLAIQMDDQLVVLSNEGYLEVREPDAADSA